MNKITSAEMSIMEIIWKSKSPLSAKQIMSALPQSKWKTTTVLTLLSRLVEKGFLAVGKNGRSQTFCQLISKAEYKKLCTVDFLSEVHQGSVKNFFAALYDGGELTQGDIDELKELLNSGEV